MSTIYLKGAAIVALIAAASAGTAQAAERVGWVWANQPNATSAYTPSSTYSYSSNNGAITVTPISTGYYEVSFRGLHSGVGTDDVQVTAYDTSGYCLSAGWGPSGSTLDAYVSCYDASGNPANSYFDLLYQERSGTFGSYAKGLAFVWANAPTTASYTPSSSYQYNSTGGTNTIVRNSTGDYTVDIPGLDSESSDVQVTAYGFTAARCKVLEWVSDGNAGTDVDVLCFDSTGTAADEEFDLAYAVKEPFGLTTAASSQGAWAWANKPADSSVYNPSAIYQYNGFATGRVTSQRTARGQYVVNIPGTLSYSTSDVLVTAYGSDSSYCNSSGWFPIYVTCYAQGGATINEDFDANYQTWH